MQSQWLNLCTYPTTITRSKRQQNLVNARCPKQAQGMGWQQHMQAIVCRCLCHGCHMTHTHPRQKNWRNSGGELQVHSRESMPFSCQVAQGTKCHLSRSSAISEKQCLAYAWHVGHAQSERIAVAKCAFFLVEWRSKSDSIQHVAPFSNNISLGKAKDEAWHGKTRIINTQPGTSRTIPSPQSFPDPRATSVVLE